MRILSGFRERTVLNKQYARLAQQWLNIIITIKYTTTVNNTTRRGCLCVRTRRANGNPKQTTIKYYVPGMFAFRLCPFSVACNTDVAYYYYYYIVVHALIYYIIIIGSFLMRSLDNVPISVHILLLLLLPRRTLFCCSPSVVYLKFEYIVQRQYYYT